MVTYIYAVPSYRIVCAQFYRSVSLKALSHSSYFLA